MNTISRSVQRSFALLELFKRERRPLTTAEVTRGMDLPHSSTVVLLTHLFELRYLDYDSQLQTYFPSRALHRLCAWIADAPSEHDPVGRLVNAVFARVGETTSVSRRSGIFSLVYYVRAAEHADAIDVRAGVTGGLMTLSVVGRALLSTLSDEEVLQIVQEGNTWSKSGQIGLHQDPEAVLRTIRNIRQRGYLYDTNLLLPGVGAVSFPLCGKGIDTPLALTIAARTQRMDRRGGRIIRDTQREVARFRDTMAAADAAEPAGPPPSRKA